LNGLPYYKAYPRDFVEGTVGMSFELKGAYRLVLDLIYLQGGALPDDAKYISGLLGCSVRAWNKYRLALLEINKIQCENGFISNFRATFELETLAKVGDKQRQNASGSRKNKDLAKPWPSHTEPEPEPDTTAAVAREASPIPKQESPTNRERLLVAIGADPVSGIIGPNGKMLGNARDMATAAKWDDVLSIDEQCAVISERMRKMTTPPGSFAYFDYAMADLVATKAKPMPQGQANSKQSADDVKLARWAKLGRKTA
jgi:uncharacterized protein YdaU (DUF1376 family)